MIVPASPPIWSPGCWNARARFRKASSFRAAEGAAVTRSSCRGTLRREVPTLPAGVGVNALASRLQSFGRDGRTEPDLVADLDTPDDLLRWNQSELPARDRQQIAVLSVQPGRPLLAKDVRTGSPLCSGQGEGRALRDRSRAATRGPGRSTFEPRSGEQFPALVPLLPNVLIAVNEEYAADDRLIVPGSRVAVIPPVSGGSSGGEMGCATAQDGRENTRPPGRSCATSAPDRYERHGSNGSHRQ